MKRTTIFVPETLERDLQLYAKREGKAVAAVVREAVAEYLAAGRSRAVEHLTRHDWKRTEQLMATYDALGLVDASVVAVAERLKLHAIATTDRRDFSVVRPAHVERFVLVPP